MTELPLQKIKQFLCRDLKIRAAIGADYGFDPTDRPETLSKRLIEALEQTAEENPEKAHKCNRCVFEKAVLAIASSSTKWVNIQNKKKEISKTLCGYNPDEVIIARDEIQSKLIKLLPGQNQSSNAAAIIKWAEILSVTPNFYENVILKTYNEIIKQQAWSVIDENKHYPMAVLCLAGIFAHPVNKWKHLKTLKFPGMLVPIACEFLRNLGWSAFKPDRHVIRAIALWEEDLKIEYGDEVEKAFCHVIDIIDTTSRTIACPIKSAIYAIYATPDGTDYSEADNLLWAFISNVVNIRQKDIVNVWLKDQLHMDQSSSDNYEKITKLGLWPNSLICEE